MRQARRTTTRTWTYHAARAAAAGAVAASLAGAPAHAADYLAQAKESLASGDLKTAQVQLRNAVRDNPQNGEAHAKLARVDLSLGDPVAAEKEARAARDLGFEPGPTTALLAETYFALGKFNAVLSDFKPDGKDPAADAAALVARGFALMTQKKTDDAKAAFEQAAKLQPNSAAPLVAEGRLAAVNGDLKAAAEDTDKALALDPKSSEARLQKAQLLRQSGDEKGAVGVLDGVIADQPTLLSARLDRAQAYLALNETDKADQDVQAVLGFQPGNVMATYLKADLQVRARDYKGADVTLTRLGDRLGNLPRGYMLQSLVKQQLGELEQAEDSARRAVARAPNDPVGVEQLARLQLFRKEPERALETLGPISHSDRADAQIDDLLAAAYAELGDSRQARGALEKAVAAQPDNPNLLAQLAAVRVRTGDPDGGMKDFGRALELAPATAQPQIAERLYFAALATGDLNRAADAVNTATDKLGADSPVAGNLQGLLAMARLDYGAARTDFEAVLKAHPDFTPAAVNLARVDGIEGHQDLMMKRLRDLVAAHPASDPELTMLVTLDLQAGDLDDAADLLRKAAAALPDNPGIVSRQAQLELQRKDPKKAIEILTASQKLQENPQILQTLSQAQAADGQMQAARDTLQKLIAQDPTQLEARRRLAALQLQAGDAELARDTIQAGLSLSPHNLALLEDYAGIDAKTKGIEAGTATADRLTSENRDYPTVAVIKGDLLLQDKRYDDAINAYAAAQAANPSVSLFALRIADTYRAAGKPDQAIKALSDWMGAHPDDLQVAEVLSTLDIMQKDYKGAIPLLEKVAAKNPGNGAVLNNLAWLYQQEGDPRALQTAQRAYTLSPGAQTADTLGWILTNQGKAQQGLGLLRQAANDARNDTRLQYHLAVALNDVGKKDEAKQVLQTLVSQPQDFEDKSSAQKLLDQLSKA